jgi:hypothetical protein
MPLSFSPILSWPGFRLGRSCAKRREVPLLPKSKGRFLWRRPRRNSHSPRAPASRTGRSAGRRRHASIPKPKEGTVSAEGIDGSRGLVCEADVWRAALSAEKIRSKTRLEQECALGVRDLIPTRLRGDLGIRCARPLAGSKLLGSRACFDVRMSQRLGLLLHLSLILGEAPLQFLNLALVDVVRVDSLGSRATAAFRQKPGGLP